jgi:hypothetical protein
MANNAGVRGAGGGEGLTELCKKERAFSFLNSGDSPNRRRRFSSCRLGYALPEI